MACTEGKTHYFKSTDAMKLKQTTKKNNKTTTPQITLKQAEAETSVEYR
jgi:hypothetical protein